MSLNDKELDLNDERFHRKVIPWAKLEAEGVEARKVMKEAQKQKMWVLARKAEHRWVNRRGVNDGKRWR